jgi:hypothetical protein
MKDIVTYAKMQKFLKTYMSQDEILAWKYIDGTQCMGDNGYAYACFIDKDGFKHTLCISDYIGLER